MSESIDDTTEHDHRAPAEDVPEGAAHGRHRGSNAGDDTPEADPHGRHRR
ncbi:hypothetical protein ACIQBJ_20660 [Kitasatospora sp. NPDC088391]